MSSILRYALFPVMLFGVGGVTVSLIGAAAPTWALWLVLGLAVGSMFVVERLIPYQPDWNRSHGDALRDGLHALVNTAANHAGLWLLPVLAAWVPWPALWPSAGWPFWLQVIAAVLVLDLGIAAAHHVSHRLNWLWRFHSVHHSAQRLYGFNGLMKHPVHQAIETAAGITPLLLLGIPGNVAQALVFLVAIQLLLQHSNADYRSGSLKYLFANAEVHRFHHIGRAGEGDVNFGLFTTLYDHMAGTFYYKPGGAPRVSTELGLHDQPGFPVGYWPQMVEPFRQRPVGLSDAPESAA